MKEDRYSRRNRRQLLIMCDKQLAQLDCIMGMTNEQIRETLREDDRRKAEAQRDPCERR